MCTAFCFLSFFLWDDNAVKKTCDPSRKPTFIFVSWTSFNRSEWGNVVNIYYLRNCCYNNSWEHFLFWCVWLTIDNLSNSSYWVSKNLCRSVQCPSLMLGSQQWGSVFTVRVWNAGFPSKPVSEMLLLFSVFYNCPFTTGNCLTLYGYKGAVRPDQECCCLGVPLVI